MRPKPIRLAAAITLDTGKFIKTHLGVFNRGENFLQNGMKNFNYTLLQSLEIALQSPTLFM